MYPNDILDVDEIVNVYSCLYDGTQTYNYEPVMQPREQGHTRDTQNNPYFDYLAANVKQTRLTVGRCYALSGNRVNW